VAGRCVEKDVDGYTTRYVHDGPHVIAEYDGHPQDGSGRNNLLRKYIYGPVIDQPVSTIEVDDNNATYYYHLDALGSVVALSDSTGDTVQTYEYSVYGEVCASDPNHPNPYMFAGRRFDIEIGLYYNRARYYNPYTGRFLQTDPVGYKAGMNLYAYCENNSIVRTDPTGLITYTFLDLDDSNTLRFAEVSGNGKYNVIWEGDSLEEWQDWAESHFDKEWMRSQPGWLLSRKFDDATGKYDKDWFFWQLQILSFIGGGVGANISSLENQIKAGKKVRINANYTVKPGYGYNYYLHDSDTFTIFWNPDSTSVGSKREWQKFPALVGLAHEIAHGADWAWKGLGDELPKETFAMVYENYARWSFFKKVPNCGWIKPRPGYSVDEATITWDEYWKDTSYPKNPGRL